jgi:hypothetical protein
MTPSYGGGGAIVSAGSAGMVFLEWVGA